MLLFNRVFKPKAATGQNSKASTAFVALQYVRILNDSGYDTPAAVGEIRVRGSRIHEVSVGEVSI
jgi:hypothetical protein